MAMAKPMKMRAETYRNKLSEDAFWKQQQAPTDSKLFDRVKVMLGKGADVHATGGDRDMTALHFAVANGAEHDVVQMLLEYGGDVHAKDVHGFSALHTAATSQASPKVVGLLLERGADVHAKTSGEHPGYGRTALHLAAGAHADPKVVGKLLTKGADVEAKAVGGFPAHGRTALHYAAENRAGPEVVASLLEKGANVHTVEEGCGDTALHLALEKKAGLQVIDVLLQQGANPNKVNSNGNTALHHAMLHGASPEIVESLLEKGANPKNENNSGSTALHLAATYRAGVRVLALLLGKGADVKAQDGNGKTPLHLAKVQVDRIESADPRIVGLLLFAGSENREEGAHGKPLLTPQEEDVARSAALEIVRRNVNFIELVDPSSLEAVDDYIRRLEAAPDEDTWEAEKIKGDKDTADVAPLWPERHRRLEDAQALRFQCACFSAVRAPLEAAVAAAVDQASLEAAVADAEAAHLALPERLPFLPEALPFRDKLRSLIDAAVPLIDPLIFAAACAALDKAIASKRQDALEAAVAEAEAAIEQVQRRRDLKEQLRTLVDDVAMHLLDFVTLVNDTHERPDELRIYVVPRDAILALLDAGAGLVVFQDLRRSNRLTELRVTKLEVLSGALREKHKVLAVSYPWQGFGDPDSTGERLVTVATYLEERPDIEYVWWDFLCVPQETNLGDITTGKVEHPYPTTYRKNDFDRLYFRIMIQQGGVNLIYLGAYVLSIANSLYIQRFWTQFEFFLGTRCVTGSRFATTHFRLVVRCIQSLKESEAEQSRALLAKWGNRTTAQAKKILANRDVTVTNQSDKDSLLGLLAKLELEYNKLFLTLPQDVRDQLLAGHAQHEEKKQKKVAASADHAADAIASLKAELAASKADLAVAHKKVAAMEGRLKESEAENTALKAQLAGVSRSQSNETSAQEKRDLIKALRQRNIQQEKEDLRLAWRERNMMRMNQRKHAATQTTVKTTNEGDVSGPPPPDTLKGSLKGGGKKVHPEVEADFTSRSDFTL